MNRIIALLQLADGRTKETEIGWETMDMSSQAMAERKEIERKWLNQEGVAVGRLLQRD